MRIGDRRICDACGKPGAFGLLSDYLCAECIDNYAERKPLGSASREEK